MLTEENKAIIRRYYESTGKEEMVNFIRQADNPLVEVEQMLLNALGEVFSSDFIIHYPEGDKSFKEDVHNLAMQIIALPDAKTTVNDMIAEGDKVVTRFTLKATHEGPLIGIPATGKKITLEAISIYRMADNKVVEGWWIGDMLGLMQQLGVVPPAGPGGG